MMSELLSGNTLGNTTDVTEKAHSLEQEVSLFLLFECENPSAGSLRISLTSLSELYIGRGNTRKSKDSSLELADRWLSSKHAKIQNSFGRWVFTDMGSKNGSRINNTSCQKQELKDGDILELGHCFFMFRHHAVIQENEEAFSLNPALQLEVTKLKKIAATDLSILILGESGSGKEVLAKRIHQWSKQARKFVPVNCGALPAGLVESELFGHKKGSFSGATRDHLGLVRQANHGTLFLDEIADLPWSAQATLLRVLQEKEVRAVGDTINHQVQIRIISATHFDINAKVSNQEFRNDLFARIAGYQVTLPALRNRKEDLGQLIAHFLQELSTPTLRFSIETGRALVFYSWPLNIRELRSCLDAAVILSENDIIECSHLPQSLLTPSRQAPLSVLNSTEEQSKKELESLFEVHHGNVSEVARQLGKDRKQIQRWVKRHSIDVNSYRKQ